MQHLAGKTILLIITGGIAAYKSLELIRLMKKDGAKVRCVLTEGGKQFVTPMTVAALSEEPVYESLFSLKDESEMGHIRLSREADAIVVVPATADFMAKVAHGFAGDLASTVLLASDKPYLMAPAMNPLMWSNPATQANVEVLENRGVTMIGPESGDAACGEKGVGRMSEPADILDAIRDLWGKRPLQGKKVVITNGPTFEAIDPVRFIGNRSSGKQGYAIAKALRDQGADVHVVSGPVNLPDLMGVQTTHIESARDMLTVVEKSLPADIFISVAAVADWHIEGETDQKVKKQVDAPPPTFQLKENPDILKTISHHNQRPDLVIGFAAETGDLLEKATHKIKRKGCDWIVGNDVSVGEGVFGGNENKVILIQNRDDNTDGVEHDEWPRLSKQAVGERLVTKIIEEVCGEQSTVSNIKEQIET
jgi:phosphopantothenoylcysteine decarboxylase/phosphopantothenate--cysteine ligase